MSNIPPAAAVPGPLLSPSYKLEQGKLGSEMRIGNWTIRSVKTAILNGKEIDAVEKELCLPLPEMTFGNNGLDLMHQGFEPSETARIPMQLLARQDPVLDRILFYEDVGLFHDELHDHGESIMNVRLRVMPHSLFLLSRLFVRVDNVLFRIFDVRMYHAFESDEVVRECTGLEGDYDEVKKYLEKPSELAPLTDPNWVYGVLQKIAAKRDDNQADQAVQTQPATQRTQAPWTQTTAAPRASSAAPRETSAPIASRPSLSNSPSSSKKPWPGLGRRVHVLRLPGTDTGLASAQAGLRDLNLEP
ncbi:hypothetical protein CcaverHIS641_0106120 [Cutaneotrichosporon cavernicola]|nr:hypothetical protein CcaverHIS641_0106120 [Cutaneotrichosporon cavernicola]